VIVGLLQKSCHFLIIFDCHTFSRGILETGKLCTVFPSQFMQFNTAHFLYLLALGLILYISFSDSEFLKDNVEKTCVIVDQIMYQGY
jgi:hypothetical protein